MKPFTKPFLESIEDLLNERLHDGTLLLDFKGHCKQGMCPKKLDDCSKEIILDSIHFFNNSSIRLMRFTDPNILQQWRDHQETEFCHMHGMFCTECGERVSVQFNGKILKIASENDTVCKFPQGLDSYTVRLNVPSGKLVCENDLRYLFNDKHIDFSLCSKYGLMRTTEEYAKIGLLHGYVGNTCPSVCVNDTNDCVSIACGEWDDLEDVYVFPEDLGTVKTGICTDLWWFSIMDYDLYNQLGGSSFDLNPRDVVTVEPGLYEMTVFTFDYDYSLPHIFAKIQKVQ